MQLRLAEPADLPAIADIYNHEVLHGTGTFDTEPVTLDSRAAWLADHAPGRHPVIVAVGGRAAGSGPAGAGEVIGWASLSRWSERCAYARAAEVSVYVHRDHRRRGAGRLLLAGLIERGRAAGLGVLLARICGEGRASVALHESLGFQRVGTMRRVGQKFGRILDIELMDLHVDGPGAVRYADTAGGPP